MLKRILSRTLVAIASLLACAGTAQAQAPLNYEPADLFLGFHATAGDGVAKCYLVNIGQASTFTNAASPFTVTSLGNIKADLDATYPGWQNDASVLWSVSGTVGSFDPVGTDPAKTLYATKAQANVGTPNPPAQRWVRNSSTTQGFTTSKMNGLADAYEFVNGDSTEGIKNQSTANSTKAYLHNVTDNDSYASYQPNGTAANSGPSPGISFAAFNPTIETNFANGTANSILELYRMAPGTAGTPGTFVGTFRFDDNANLTFTPAPVAPKPEVKFSSATYSGSETGGTISLTLTRTGDMTGGFTVSFSTANGSATAPDDYATQTNVPVNFTASDTSKTVNVTVQNRPGFQGDRTFTATLSNPTNDAVILSPGTATVTILEAETGVQFDSATYAVSETGTNAVVKLVRVGAAAAFTATVNTADVVGEAVAGTDYTAQVNVPVEFLVSDTEKTLNIPVANRTGIQGDRDFTATISNATNGVAIGTPAVTVVTIEDVVNSGTVVFNPTTYTQAEPATGMVTVTVTATRSGGTDGNVSVEVVAAGTSTAQAPGDYTLPSTPVVLEWDEGVSGTKTFDVTINSDAVSETTTETIVLQMQNAAGGVVIGAQNSATITLPGEDSTAPTLTVTAPKNKAKITNNLVTFTGTANDAVGVARVQVSINNGAIVNETLNVPPSPAFNWSLGVIPEQGANVAVVTAFDVAGNPSNQVTVELTFTNSRPGLAGKYNGLLVSTAPTDLFLRNGLVNVTVGKTGTFTGSVTIAGTKLPFSGLFLTGNGTTAEARFGKLKTPTLDLVKKAKPANIPLGSLALSLSTNGGLEVTGTLKSGANTLANISTDLAVYTSKKSPVLPLKNVPTTLLDPTREKGKYTGALVPGAIVAGQPAGNGYGTLSISTSGVVKFVGKAADGSSISYSNTLSTDNRWPVFVQLYSKQGFIAGEVQFDPTQTLTDGAGDLTWFKPANLPKQTLYPAGWPNGIASDFIASKYLVPTAPTTRNPNPPNPATALGPGVPGAVGGAANIEVELNNGALANNTSNDASIDAKSKVTVLGATTGGPGAANGLAVAFKASTGAMSGSFTHPGQPKALKFAGVAFQKTSEAYGQFLFLPKAPATQESGGVFIEEK